MNSKKHSWISTSATERNHLTSKIPSGLYLHPSIVESVSTTFGNILDFPRQSGLLTITEIDITENYDAVSLLDAMASGKLTSLAVTTAFCKRAAIAHQLVSDSMY